jgi:hypothetical protein
MTVLAYEIHSELAVVCPEVRREALPILATEHEAHLARYHRDAADLPAPVARPAFALALAVKVLDSVATTVLQLAVFMAVFCALALILTLLA